MPIQMETLRKIPFFNLFPNDEQLADFLKTGKWSKFGSGGVIYRVGDPALNMYVIASGKVGINRNKKNLAALGSGDIFGEVGPLLGLDRTVNAVSLGDSVVFEFSLAELERTPLETRYTILKHLYVVSTRRFVETTRRIACS